MFSALIFLMSLYKEPVKKFELPEQAPQSISTYRWQA